MESSLRLSTIKNFISTSTLLFKYEIRKLELELCSIPSNTLDFDSLVFLGVELVVI